MEIDIGSTVECVEGDAGKVAGIIVDRASMKLVGLVVARGRIAPEDIVVPMEVVRNAEPNRVYLRVTARELEDDYHRLKEREYVPLGDDWAIPPPDSPEEMVVTSLPAIGSEPPLVPIQSDLRHPFLLRELVNVPEGAAEVNGETTVLCPEGPVGSLAGVLFDPATNTTTHLLLRLITTPALPVSAPAYLVSRIEDREIYLNAPRALIESLPPPTQADREIGEDQG